MSSKKIKSHNEQIEIKNREYRDNNINSANISEMLNNLGDIEKSNVNYLEKSCQIMKIILNENERLKEEAYGYKYIDDENKKYLIKVNNNVDELRQENEKLKIKLNNYDKQSGGFNYDFVSLFKNYTSELSESKKRDIEGKYKQYLFYKKTD